MCSVSIFLKAGTLLLTANRDELRSRGESGVKKEHNNDVKYIYPIDAEAKGTWVGANNYGVAAALLNMYEAEHPGARSRGSIIPKLLNYNSFSQAHEYLMRSFNPNQYATFVLLLMNRQNVHRYSWNGITMDMQNLTENPSSWLFETSSSVDTSEIRQHRQELFQNWRENTDSSNIDSRILKFHLTQDKNNTSFSVLMAREQTHTKSITQISINANEGELRYLPPDLLESVVNKSPQIDILNTNKFNILETKSSKQQSNTTCVL